MRLSLIACMCLISITACKTKQQIVGDFSKEAQAIEAVMKMQEIAWSEGDIEKFMTGYWKSEKLSFGGKRGFTYGYDNVLYNYKRGYPTKEVMGSLTFEIIDIFPINDSAAYLLGKYMLEAKDSDSSGYFTLVWRKIDGEWKIVSDHTSG